MALNTTNLKVVLDNAAQVVIDDCSAQLFLRSEKTGKCGIVDKMPVQQLVEHFKKAVLGDAGNLNFNSSRVDH